MSIPHFHSQSDLDAAMQALVAQDARLAPILAATGRPPLRRRPAGFAGLAGAICGQQLSTAAAAAIWARIVKAFGDPAHHHFRVARTDRLRRFGLSAAKIKTLKHLAGEIHHGRLDLGALADLPADDAHNILIALHGIGPWTADIYLLFCLGHGDAWPSGDLALQEAIRVALKLDARPSAKQAVQIADAWRPYRGAAAHLFWAYYRVANAKAFVAAPPTAAPDRAPASVPKRPGTTPGAKRRGGREKAGLRLSSAPLKS